MRKSKATWQRARRPEQKQERIDAILEAAAALLDEDGLEGTGLNAIARRAGMSKANVYGYFESREAILLRLYLDETEAWSRALSVRLRKLGADAEIPAVARAYTATIERRRRFCTLFASVASVLEHNVGADTVAAFKREFVETVEPVVVALAVAIPPLSRDQAFSALATLVMATIGFWPHAHPAPVVREVLARPEFTRVRIDFKSTVEAHATAYLTGVVANLRR